MATQGLDNKISNIIGTKLPHWVLRQLETRSNQNTKDSRDNDNLLYLANKSAWVRLVSSIDILDSKDLTYFKNNIGANITLDPNNTIQNQSSLAKEYILFGGTSRYLKKNSYDLRSGIEYNGAYGMLGTQEIQKYGYRPMPGITSVNIETQGRLGSVRAAVINFKCWDKLQLDIIDALYFKLGFTMFLEWGHTNYYPSEQKTIDGITFDPNKIASSELFSIDPFETGLNKEDILSRISENARNSEGNYDAMLGVVTNFNFTYNQEGGYDCTVRIMALGVLAEGIKINNPGVLPNILQEEIVELNLRLDAIRRAVEAANKAAAAVGAPPEVKRPDDVNSYPDCIKPGTLAGAELRVTTAINGKPAPFYSHAIFANVNNNVYYFYYDGRYQTTGLSKNGTYDCRNGVLFIDGVDQQKVIFDIGFAKKLEDIIKNNQAYYWFPSNKPTTGNPNWDGSDVWSTEYRLNPSYTAVAGYYIRSLNAIIPSSGPLTKEVTVKLNSSIFNAQYQFGNNKTFTNTKEWEKTGIINVDKKIENTYTINNRVYSIKTTILYKVNPVNSTVSVTVPPTTLGTNTAEADVPWLELTKISDTTFERIVKNIDTAIKNPNVLFQVEEVMPPSNRTTVGNIEPISIILKGAVVVPINVTGTLKVGYDEAGTNKKHLPNEDVVFSTDYNVEFLIEFNNSALVEGITSTNQVLQPGSFKPYVPPITTAATSTTTTATPVAAPKPLTAEAAREQVASSLNLQSALEITLRTIEIHALNRAVKETKDEDIKKKVFVNKFWNDKIGKKNKDSFLTSLFSNGIFSPYIDQLVNDSIQDTNYSTQQKMSSEERFQIQAKYGFATNLMANKADISELKDRQVDYKELLTAYVVPYQINQEIIKGTYVNHPVYIQLGLLLMILNHSCTIYDTKDNKFQTPLVYMDFNPELNFFLTNTKHLSTNPWTLLIPFEGGFNDYQQLFDDTILNGNKDAILPPEGSKEETKLFNPQTQDVLSGQLPKIKFGKLENNIYRGRMMNILLNIDYVVNLVQQYSSKDAVNSVYLKPFLENLLSDMNKYLGNFNTFRLSYSDSGNTFQITDDQFIPALSEEDQISAKQNKLEKDNRTEIPLVGKNSIAKSVEIKTEVSSKLANMLAISANADISNKSTLSTNGTSYGYINENYIDRYIPNRQEITGSGAKVSDTIKTSAGQFNKAISEFYSKINPSETNVSHATNYYIEKMSRIKNDEYPTRASQMIPVSVNFKTDGIAGMGMGQAFTVPDELLPYTYSTKTINNGPADHVNNVGFVMVGLSHTIDNNSWNTSVSANMIYLKDKTEFRGNVTNVSGRSGQFGGESISIGGSGNFGGPPLSSTDCGCTRCPPGAGPKKWNEKKQKWERTYSCADQVDAPESVNSTNFGSGRKYYGTYTFKKGTSDINLSKAGLSPLQESEIVDDTTQNRFLIGTITTNPDDRTFVVHHTAGGYHPASRTYETFYSRGLPAQYVIDGNAQIHRFMPDGAKGWHAGDYNGKSIGVEISAMNNAAVTDAQARAAVRLIHYLGFKKSQVVGHGEISDYKEETEGKKVVDIIRSL